MLEIRRGFSIVGNEGGNIEWKAVGTGECRVHLTEAFFSLASGHMAMVLSPG